MKFFEIIGISFGLAMDAFAVSLAISAALKGVSLKQVVRLAVSFGLFQAAMPVIGWFAGLSVERWISAYDHWAAFALLAFIGGRMIIGSLKGGERIDAGSDPTQGITLIVLSIATSIDALAVGLSFAMLEISVWYPCVVIGAVAFIMTSIGMLAGMRLGVKFGRRTELAGGLILIAIGLKIIVSHTIG